MTKEEEEEEVCVRFGSFYLEIMAMHVIEPFVIIHPHFSEAHRIASVNITFA
jgi:hypothetical protein